MDTLAAYADRHPGATILVCGCGRSLHTLPRDHGLATIGVNDIGRLFDPDYLVVVNPPGQFRDGRFRWVRESRAKALFTQLELGPVAPPVVRFRLGRFGGTATGPDTLDYTQNSPYVAVLLAAHLGAARIGLIGVDFDDGHFFGATGPHPLAARLAEIDAQYAALHAALARRGVELVNLSPTSRLAALPRADIAGWAGAARPAPAATPALRIVSYATTPVAGVPAVLARCIAHATPHAARCVWATDRYANGVAFDGDLQWSTHPREAGAALAAADAVIVHNGRVDPRHARLLAGKPLLTLAHNYGWNVDMALVRAGQPGLVVAQYQATLPEFAGWTAVPNPLPLWEAAYRPEPKPDTVTIAFTPSGAHERYPPGHRLYWHAKGALSTLALLDRLAREGLVQLEVLRGGAVVPHAQALAMKRRAHIVIDECVTGSYHRNSLEGLAAGCVVVNGLGQLPGVEEVLRRCAPDAGDLPFERATPETLEAVLRALVALGPEALVARGAANRAWVERHWDFADQWRHHWKPALDRALDATRAPRRPVSTPVQEEPAMPAPLSANARVSVVVPHGGRERLPLLAATLASLRQSSAVAEIVVVELGAEPVAEALSLRWADRHLFIAHDGAFERATALNAGTAQATQPVVAWHDNDLLHAPEFLGRALAELAARRLDMLVPYTAVHYLDAEDSRRVARGELAPEQAAVVQRLTGRIGCIGLVRRDFVQRHGGLIEGFRGWGGEDDAWFHKAALCGRLGRSQRPDQPVFHLHHPLSGGIAPGQPGAANPHYAANLERLAAVRATRDAATLAQRFPSATPAAGVLHERRPVAARSDAGVPVWTYWEGPCPSWIRACRRTLLHHVPGLRLLTPETFAALRAGDPEMGALDLSHLHVAHRADAIRAWLLARFGGLWIDADCLLMRPPHELPGWLAAHDFVGHRMRSGPISNAFIAAPPGSRIAAAYWAQVRDIVARRQRVGWNFGGDLLTAVVERDPRGWHELPVERVQPVCWSRPQDFLAERDAAAHEAQVDGAAIAYMLSNVELGKRFPAEARSDALLAPRSFFTHLLKRSLGGADPRESLAREAGAAQAAELFRRHRCESVSGTGSSLAQTAGLRRRLPLLLEHLGVHRLLDAPCGDRHWMRTVELPGIEVTGVELLAELVAAHRVAEPAANRHFVAADLLDDALPQALPAADAVFCRDLLVHLPYAEIARVLRRFAATGATWLITTHFTQPRPNRDIARGDWRPLHLQGAPFDFPPPRHLLVEGCTEGGGAYADKCVAVWRFADLASRPFLAAGAAAPADAAAPA
ncbi:glycosyltransferase [Piscinibacter defluvii]|uniref:glycosyltransferase n=1 Tax=Piscinibacter defluvii TaxID=1796922 RepID=UPI000FDCFB27|nr:glycosyltransferase [Piscinibacter defluvii]